MAGSAVSKAIGTESNVLPNSKLLSKIPKKLILIGCLYENCNWLYEKLSDRVIPKQYLKAFKAKY